MSNAQTCAAVAYQRESAASGALSLSVALTYYTAHRGSEEGQNGGGDGC